MVLFFVFEGCVMDFFVCLLCYIFSFSFPFEVLMTYRVDWAQGTTKMLLEEISTGNLANHKDF